MRMRRTCRWFALEHEVDDPEWLLDGPGRSASIVGPGSATSASTRMTAMTWPPGRLDGHRLHHVDRRGLPAGRDGLHLQEPPRAAPTRARARARTAAVWRSISDEDGCCEAAVFHSRRLRRMGGWRGSVRLAEARSPKPEARMLSRHGRLRVRRADDRLDRVERLAGREVPVPLRRCAHTRGRYATMRRPDAPSSRASSTLRPTSPPLMRPARSRSG